MEERLVGVDAAPWSLESESSFDSSGSSRRTCLGGVRAASLVELWERVSVLAGAALPSVPFGPVVDVEREGGCIGRADLVVTALRQRDTTA